VRVSQGTPADVESGTAAERPLGRGAADLDREEIRVLGRGGRARRLVLVADHLDVGRRGTDLRQLFRRRTQPSQPSAIYRHTPVLDHLLITRGRGRGS
jgi:hypothetical protein